MNTHNDELSRLPNIGKVLAEKLKLVGIEDANDIRKVGAENAFIRLKTVDREACGTMLYAIEGAIQGIKWHNLVIVRKEELKKFFRMINRH